MNKSKSDGGINEVLKEVKLFEAILKLPMKTEDLMENLSLPQRQMLCLAKCILNMSSWVIVKY